MKLGISIMRGVLLTAHWLVIALAASTVRAQDSDLPDAADSGAIRPLHSRPALGIVAGPASMREPHGLRPAVPGRFSVSRTQSNQHAIVIHLEYSGTALAADYASLPQQILMPAGVTRVSVDVLPLEDSLVEGTESFTVKIAPPIPPIDPAPNAPVYAISPAVHLRIDDDDGLPSVPVVSIRSSRSVTAEPGFEGLAEPAVLEVNRTEAGSPLRVLLSYSGTAQSSDCEALPAELLLPAGVSTTNISVRALPDAFHETDETLIVQLRPRSSAEPDADGFAYTLDPQHFQIALQIKDSFLPGPPGLPVISASEWTKITAEPASNLVVALGSVNFRCNPPPALNTLRVFFSVEGTATPGLDYPSFPASVEFGIGQREVRLNLRALDDSIREPLESVFIQLKPSPDPRWRYFIDPLQSSATLLINDTDFNLFSTAATIPETESPPRPTILSIQSSLDLLNWTNLQTTALDLPTTATDPARNFYRLRVE